MLEESRTVDTALVAQYGHLLPDTLIRSTIDAADAPQVADADLAALAEAVLRSPGASSR